MMKAAATLEMTTKLSIECCRLFVQSNAHTILLSLISSCNRSAPHLELISLILSILTNVANRPSIVSSLATDEAINVLNDLIQIFRDKANIIASSSSLLEIILKSSDHLSVSYTCLKR